MQSPEKASTCNSSATPIKSEQIVRIDKKPLHQNRFVGSVIDEAYEMEIKVLRTIELKRKGA